MLSGNILMYKGYYDNQYRPRFTTIDGSQLPDCLDKGTNGWASFYSWSLMYPKMITDPSKSTHFLPLLT